MGWDDFFSVKGEPFDKFATAESFRQRALADGFATMIDVLAKTRR